MKFYNTRKFSDGEYWTTEFTADEMTSINVMTLVVVACILAPLAAIASGILVLVCIHDLEDEGIVPSLAGLVISGLFMLDIYYHFIIKLILYIMLGEEWTAVLFHLNAAYLCMHLFMIFFGKAAFVSFGDKKSLVYTCLAIGAVAYLLSSALIAIRPY